MGWVQIGREQSNPGETGITNLRSMVLGRVVVGYLSRNSISLAR